MSRALDRLRSRPRGDVTAIGPTSQESPAPRDPVAVARRRLGMIAVLCAVAVVGYLLYDVQGAWGYAMSLRSRQVTSLVVVGAAIGASSLAFQTVAGNRILTPGVMGFDSVYVLAQTLVVFFLGASTLQLMGVVTRFALNTAILVAFGLLLFRWLFRRHSHDLFVLVLVGIVMGTLFASLASLASRLLSPDDFLTLQTVLFASFSTADVRLLSVTAATTVVGLLLLWPLARRLDVLELGREAAIGLGLDYHRTVTRVLVVVTVLVATATALVGPMVFLGLLVANLTRHLLPTHRHALLLPAAALVGVLCTVLGQLVVQHVFDLRTTLSVVVNLVGGTYFILLLMRSSRL